MNLGQLVHKTGFVQTGVVGTVYLIHDLSLKVHSNENIDDSDNLEIEKNRYH